MSKINETNYPRRTQASYEDTDMLVIQKSGGNTYTTRIEDLREDYEETLAPTLSALQDDVNENLATIEAGSTASQAYAKGNFLVFGGRLCKAKTSIAVNATLVLDTNIELASVGGELSSISSDLASYKNVMPTAMACGKTTFPAAEVGLQDVQIAFPAGRFSSAPKVFAMFNDTNNVTSYMEPGIVAYNVTTAYATLRAKRIVAAAGWDVAWIAVQM